MPKPLRALKPKYYEQIGSNFSMVFKLVIF